jgi:nitroreductase
MEFADVVRRRRMVRSYTDEPVDPAVVERALEHATRAPSAGFSQGWAFVVLDRPEDVRRFWTASTDDVDEPDRWLAGMMRAPVVVVPCSVKGAYLDRYAEPDKGWTDRDEARWPMPFWHLDTAMASLLVLQTVTDAGLGACFFGIVPGREQDVRRALGLPDDGDPHPIGAITIGHPAPRGTGARGSASRRRRTPWTEVAHRGRYGAGWSGDPR